MKSLLLTVGGKAGSITLLTNHRRPHNPNDEVENEIVPVGDLDPDQIHTPGVYVNRIVRIPPDGIWA